MHHQFGPVNVWREVDWVGLGNPLGSEFTHSSRRHKNRAISILDGIQYQSCTAAGTQREAGDAAGVNILSRFQIIQSATKIRDPIDDPVAVLDSCWFGSNIIVRSRTFAIAFEHYSKHCPA